MAVKLGSTDVSFRLGATTPAAVYLGSEQVWSAASVPGAPTITSAVWDGFYTTVAFDPPASDGGSAILSGNVYFDDDLIVGELTDGSFAEGGTLQFDQNYSGYYATITAVNAVGEGPPSASFGVVDES